MRCRARLYKKSLEKSPDLLRTPSVLRYQSMLDSALMQLAVTSFLHPINCLGHTLHALLPQKHVPQRCHSLPLTTLNWQRMKCLILPHKVLLQVPPHCSAASTAGILSAQHITKYTQLLSNAPSETLFHQKLKSSNATNLSQGTRRRIKEGARVAATHLVNNCLCSSLGMELRSGCSNDKFIREVTVPLPHVQHAHIVCLGIPQYFSHLLCQHANALPSGLLNI